MHEPPRVTVVDPSRPERGPVDELGEDGPPSRRGLYAVLVLVVLLAGWRAADAVLDRRASSAQERRLQAVVDLRPTARFSGGSQSRDPADVATVERQVGLRNAGPRPVTVLSASVGPLTFEGSAGIEPGRDLALLLRRRVSCAQRPADEPVEETLRMSVRVADGTVVERRLRLPPDTFVSDPSLLQRACGYLEPYEAGTAVPSGSVRLVDGSLLVDLLVGNSGRAPLVLARLRGGSGMAVTLRTVDGRPAVLPLVVPPGVGAGELPSLSVTVDVRVEDCSAVVPPDPGSELLDQASAATLVTSFAAVGLEPTPNVESFTPLEQSQSVADLLELSCR